MATRTGLGDDAGEHHRPSGLAGLLRQHRVRVGMTQEELADAAGLSVRALRDMELHRVRLPREESVRRLAKALALSDPECRTLMAALREPAAAGWSALVQVLGTVTVRRGGKAVGIGSPLVRSLLGLLALQPGRLVAADEIVDVLWGGMAPKSCRNLVHLYVGRIRELLEPDRRRGTAGSTVIRSGGGYALTLARDQVDVYRFEDLLADSRRARAAGDCAAALAQLQGALACWRGGVAADANPRLRQHPVARTLAQLRIGATLDWADLALEAGRAAETIAALRSLATEEPFHEGLHARLIVALAACGQQAAALAVFTDLRRQLADELGVEPGAELRAAHLRILRQEVADQPSSSGARGADARIAAQLPADLAAFAGRSSQLARLDAALRTPATSVLWVITGTAGVGKTALAVHWAHRVANQFPDGQLYVNLRGFDARGQVMSSADAVRGFLDALAVPVERIPADLDAQVAMYRSVLAGKRMLVVLDNARDAEQVRSLLPGTSTAVTLVTSRNQLTPLVATEGARPLGLDVLSTGEARRLLAARLGEQRVTAEAHAVETIINSCARLPLALAIAAARAQQTGFPLAAIAAELRDANHRLEALDAGDDSSQVRTVFSWSYTAVSPPAARLFRLLSMHPVPDISAAAAASLAGCPLAVARQLLAELARASLFTEHTAGRYTWHDLLRVYATDLTNSTDLEPDRRAATTRLLDHLVHTAHAADRLINPLREPIELPLDLPAFGTVVAQLADDQQATHWLSTEHPALLAALHYAAEAGLDTRVWQLAWTIETFLIRRGYRRALIGACQSALGAADRLNDPHLQAYTHRALTVASMELERYDDAHQHARRALELSTRTADLAGQARTHRRLAYLYWQQGNPRKGLRHAERALRLFRAAGDERGIANELNGIGWYHAELGNYPQALTYCERALALLDQLGDQVGAAYTWDSLGYVHHQLGRHDDAVACYHQAMVLHRQLGDRHDQADTLTRLGDTKHAAGHSDAARTAWQQALHILTDIDHPDAERLRERLATGAL